MCEYFILATMPCLPCQTPKTQPRFRLDHIPPTMPAPVHIICPPPEQTCTKLPLKQCCEKLTTPPVYDVSFGDPTVAMLVAGSRSAVLSFNDGEISVEGKQVTGCLFITCSSSNDGCHCPDAKGGYPTIVKEAICGSATAFWDFPVSYLRIISSPPCPWVDLKSSATVGELSSTATIDLDGWSVEILGSNHKLTRLPSGHYQTLPQLQANICGNYLIQPKQTLIPSSGACMREFVIPSKFLNCKEVFKAFLTVPSNSSFNTEVVLNVL